jgi:hypothetical protein
MSQPALGLRKIQVSLSQESIQHLIDSLQKGEQVTVIGGDETNYATRLTIIPEKGSRYS